MATHEQEKKRVIAWIRVLRVRDSRGGMKERVSSRGLFAAPARRLAARVIGHPPRGDLDQPAARVLRKPVARPLNGRCDQRLLHGIFGRGEVSVASDDAAENLWRQLAQQALGAAIERG
jgi:hypothetical protein